MKIVVDTNILISALGWKGNEYTLLEKCINKKITLVISLDIIEEFRKVALRSKFGFTKEEVEDFTDALIETAIVVQPTEIIDIIKEDLPDNRILECAIEGKANYIVSGDKHLLNLKEFKEIKISTSSEVLKIID